MPLDQHDSTLVSVELNDLKAGDKTTRKHNARTHGEGRVASTADDSYFAR